VVGSCVGKAQPSRIASGGAADRLSMCTSAGQFVTSVIGFRPRAALARPYIAPPHFSLDTRAEPC
jgi:hypothetical protein